MTTYELVDAMTSIGSNLVQGQNYMLGESLRYAAQLNEMRGGIPRGELVGPFATATVLGLRLFIFGGALTFMWRVRHPKTE